MQKGREIRKIVAELFAKYSDGLVGRGVVDPLGRDDIVSCLRRIERCWVEQIR